ncbi:MAG: acetyl-CoA carboxylase biotin carboxyl carrier protein [Peptococcaceae bacterium]
MNIQEIKELMQALEQSTLASLEVSQGDSRVRLEKYGAMAAVADRQTATAAPVLAQPPVTEVPQAVISPVAEAKAGSSQPEGQVVSCPLVGVFYAAPSPEDVPFVSVGSTVKKGDVLCIVEAMKLMNEITAEQDGVITKICAENGQVVEYGQPLFYLS